MKILGEEGERGVPTDPGLGLSMPAGRRGQGPGRGRAEGGGGRTPL